MPKGVEWSLGLTNEAGYLFALLDGLAVANFLPAFAAWLKEAGRTSRLARAGKLPHYVLPDCSISLRWDEIEPLIRQSPSSAAQELGGRPNG